MHLLRQYLGAFGRRDADCFAGFEVDKSRGDFSPIAKFEGALTQSAAGDDSDGIGHTAVNLNEGNQALAILAVGIVKAEQLEAKHGHANAEYLAGAQVSMGYFRITQKFVKRLQSENSLRYSSAGVSR
jgi:hypothetical protein